MRGSGAAQRVNVAFPWGKSFLTWVEIMSRWQINMRLLCGSLQGPRDISESYTTYFAAHGPTGRQCRKGRRQGRHRVLVTTYTLAEPLWSRKAGVATPIPQERTNAQPSCAPLLTKTLNLIFIHCRFLSKIIFKSCCRNIQWHCMYSPKGFRKEIWHSFQPSQHMLSFTFCIHTVQNNKN